MLLHMKNIAYVIHFLLCMTCIPGLSIIVVSSVKKLVFSSGYASILSLEFTVWLLFSEFQF